MWLRGYKLNWTSTKADNLLTYFDNFYIANKLNWTSSKADHLLTYSVEIDNILSCTLCVMY